LVGLWYDVSSIKRQTFSARRLHLFDELRQLLGCEGAGLAGAHLD
jgi:hypothetical protein